MADFEKIIPFIFHFSAGIHGDDLLLPLHLQFEKARLTGWSNDPDDPGGATMIDVTISAYSTYRRRQNHPDPSEKELYEISYNEWRDILKAMYWDRWKADEIDSQGIANILVDWVWASGAASVKKAQNIIGVKADGIVGPKTIGAINRQDADILFDRIHNAREDYYRRCRSAWKYLKGWLRRLNAIRPDGTFSLK